MPQSKHRRKRTPSPHQSRRTTRKKPPSPTWYVATMTGLMLVGVLLVVLRFVFVLDQWVLLVGLGMIAAGFLMTANYR